jgi:hypothetical protein
MSDAGVTILAFVISFAVLFGYAISLGVAHWRARADARRAPPSAPSAPGAVRAKDATTAEVKPRGKVGAS